jgi:hypothetical protein
MAYINKTIHGYLVELESGSEWSDCWVMQGGYGSSLGFLQDTGGLIHDTIGDMLEVSPRTIQAITKWAESNGY